MLLHGIKIEKMGKVWKRHPLDAKWYQKITNECSPLNTIIEKELKKKEASSISELRMPGYI